MDIYVLPQTWRHCVSSFFLPLWYHSRHFRSFIHECLVENRTMGYIGSGISEDRYLEIINAWSVWKVILTHLIWFETVYFILGIYIAQHMHKSRVSKSLAFPVGFALFTWFLNSHDLFWFHHMIMDIIIVDCSFRMLGITDHITDFGHFNWQLALCLLFVWTLVCLCLVKGIKASGKVSLTNIL